jgi:serine/threonine-protein kinase
VVPRSTAFRYKGREAEAAGLGRALNADAVITGRVTLREGSLGVGMELVDVARESQVWGERFTRPLDEIFALQGQLARAVSERLQPDLTEEDRKRLGNVQTRDGDAYRLYLRGRHQWDKRSVDGITRSIGFYESAIARDPGLALAYAGLADAYVALRDLPPRETRPKARAAALRALELDNALPEAHTSLAMTRFVFDWDWPEAERAFRRAIELSPEHATAHHWYGLFLMAMGRFDEARAQLKLAYEKDPLSPIIQVNLGRTEFYAGRADLAVVRLQEVVRTEENFAWAHGVLSLAYARSRRFEEAVRSAERARALDDGVDAPAWAGYAYAVAGRRKEAVRVARELDTIAARRYLPPFRVSLVHTALGDKDRAFAWLEKAYEDRSPWLAYIKHDPTLDPLRSDRRFDDLLKRVGLKEFGEGPSPAGGGARRQEP